jgi:hypothetical protein
MSVEAVLRQQLSIAEAHARRECARAEAAEKKIAAVYEALTSSLGQDPLGVRLAVRAALDPKETA